MSIRTPVPAGPCRETPARQVRSHQRNRHQMISVAAYYLAEERGFAPGHAEADWLAAERLIDATLAGDLTAARADAPAPSAVRYALRL